MEPTPPNQKIPNLLQAARQAPPPSDLIDPVPSPAAIERRRFWKLLVLDVCAVATAVGLGLSCLLYVAGGLRLLWLLGALGIFLLASFFDFLLTRDWRHRMLAGLLQILAFLSPFYSAKPSALVAALVALIVFFFLGERGATQVSENSLKFSLWIVARTHMKKIFTGIVLAVILLHLPQAGSGSVFVSKEQFQRWYGGFADFAHGFYANLDFKASVGAFADSIARTELAANPQFRTLPPEAQDKALAESSRLLIANAAKSAGLQLTPEMSLSDAFYNYVLELFSRFREQFGQSFLAVWAAALFAIIWSLGTIFVWIVVAASYLVYELLAAMNVLRIGGEMRTKEVVELG